MVWEPGKKLHGDRYTIEQPLKPGGFGITYIARHRKGDRVVIKTLKDEVLESPDYREYREKYLLDFEREARRLGHCLHPHIVRIHTYFYEGGIPYMVMEYIQGRDLWERVRNGGCLSETDALRYVRQIGSALSFVHEKGLLHRDVKPHNILLRACQTEAVLIDFGIAREFVPNVTQRHTNLVTDGFAPIEQYYEEARRGEYTDVYALAATLYFLATQKVPPLASIRSAQDMLKLPREFNKELSQKMERAILQGMAVWAEDRPQTMKQWLALLPRGEEDSGRRSPIEEKKEAESRSQPIPRVRVPETFRSQPRSRSKSFSFPLKRRGLLVWLGLGLSGAFAIERLMNGERETDGNPTLPELPPPLPEPSSPPPLPLQFSTLSFETVTVNETGEIAERQPGKAEFYQEDLGDGVLLDMVKVPAGKFVMGSPESEVGRWNDEGPQREVTVSKFWIGRYEVTQVQWQAVAKLPKIDRDLEPDLSRFKGAKRPVERVSWNDAVEFCKRLSWKTGREYRLPSEAEWEYACRAGTTTPFHFGATVTTELANYNGNSTYASGPKGAYREQTTKIGSFPPNGFGLHDMHGNVWEWCADPWHDNYEGAPKDSTIFLSSDKSKYVLRGGSWDNPPGFCRSAFRDRPLSGDRNDGFGFRACCSPPRAL